MQHSTDSGAALNAVRVEAPARLHLGFIDVSATLGRRFGSLGVALDDFATVLELRRSAQFDAQGPQAERAGGYLRRLLEDHDPATSVSLRVLRAIPQHVGLGSGTQLALAVGGAFSALFGIRAPVAALAARLDRGARSGIGIGAFEQGGFVIDGGRGTTGSYPPVIARAPFPSSWRVLLVFDRAQRGLFGEEERTAFRTLPAFPQEQAAHLAHLTLMRLMPALVEHDFASFAAAVGEIQAAVGDYFAPAQGGRFASSSVRAALAWIEAQGVRAVGQTSWGPTGFALLESEVSAHALLVDVRERFARSHGLEFAVVGGRNHGHRLYSLAGARAQIQQDIHRPASFHVLGRRG
jgi:beta-RFAP synthase